MILGLCAPGGDEAGGGGGGAPDIGHARDELQQIECDIFIATGAEPRGIDCIHDRKLSEERCYQTGRLARVGVPLRRSNAAPGFFRTGKLREFGLRPDVLMETRYPEDVQTAYIGMGGNIESAVGPPDVTLAAAVGSLQSVGRVVCSSSLYSTEPVGYAEQPRFVNAVVEIQTALSPHELLEALLNIEREFGRDRSSGIRNGPRTLDLDILLYGNAVLHQSDLDIPHPRLAEREFVLVPLGEIASNLVVASHSRSVKQLLDTLRGRLPTESNAILPFQSDVWRAGPCGIDDRERTASADPDR